MLYVFATKRYKLEPFVNYNRRRWNMLRRIQAADASVTRRSSVVLQAYYRRALKFAKADDAKF